MSQAEELLRELLACRDAMAAKQWIIDPEEELSSRYQSAWTATRAYLNEKPHEPHPYACQACGALSGDFHRPGCSRESLNASPPHAEPEKPMNDDLPGMLAVAKGVAEQKWPHTMDAKVWTEQWLRITKDMPRESFNDFGLMVSWFANAIMAGYDTAQSRSGSYKEGWKDCVKAHDGLYPPHAEFQSSAHAEPVGQPRSVRRKRRL